MRAAVPLLKQAFGVTLLTINQPTGTLAVGDAVHYLKLRDINAGALTMTTDGRVAEAILQRAHAERARYIVMGAYSKGRAAQAVFGGVTQSVLRESEVPLLLFH